MYVSSVQFSCSVVSDSLWPHGLQHTRPPCPSPTPGVYPNSCPLSWWCHPAVSSSVVSFSSRLQSFPASNFSFQMNQFFTSGGQSIGVSASASALSMNTQDWSLGWTDWISLQSKGLSKAFSNTTVQKHQLFSAQLSCLSLNLGKVDQRMNTSRSQRSVLSLGPGIHMKKMGQWWGLEAFSCLPHWLLAPETLEAWDL